MWYIITAGIGIAVGFILNAWARTIPTVPAHSHTECDDRYERMSRKYRHTIQTLEAEVQNLIHGGDVYVAHSADAASVARNIQ